MMGDDSEIDDGCEEIAACIALLEDATGKTTEFNRKVL